MNKINFISFSSQVIKKEKIVEKYFIFSRPNINY